MNTQEKRITLKLFSPGNHGLGLDTAARNLMCDYKHLSVENRANALIVKYSDWACIVKYNIAD